MSNATFAAPDLTTFCLLDGLGFEAVGQHLEPDRAVIECRVVETDPLFRKCGAGGRFMTASFAGWRMSRSAQTDNAASANKPLSVCALSPDLAPGHHAGGRAESEDLPWWTDPGVGGDRR